MSLGRAQLTLPVSRAFREALREVSRRLKLPQGTILEWTTTGEEDDERTKSVRRLMRIETRARRPKDEL